MTETNINFKIFKSVRGNYVVFRDSIERGIPIQMKLKTFSNHTKALLYKHEREQELSR
jgi:hypothetical protein